MYVSGQFHQSRVNIIPISTAYCQVIDCAMDAHDTGGITQYFPNIVESCVSSFLYLCWVPQTFVLQLYFKTSRGDKVNMLTHACQHKPLRKIKWQSADHFTFSLMSDLVICKQKSMVIHGTECPY